MANSVDGPSLQCPFGEIEVRMQSIANHIGTCQPATLGAAVEFCDHRT